ncbi:MAG: nitroreductase [Chloroflexi bacterium AL-W]|nr:nitroreductase [Chloroflexi bacterium AL-N1]NOK70442.1 nitroreductase [Chloroflexi bacterium AL-N10]NOK78199.1 nitroreductase [Chloroflexi bacterium AL-N5]NOK85298.1 nitroreductase [Chloroflexi bacterium AL-W]NOK92063.1 nitroreductase [Chloroflexi bacterium AL-N15]
MERNDLDLTTIIRGRRSVRRYQDRPVAHQHIMEILAAAGWAPSPHGRQPWRFVVLTRAEPKQQLAEAMGDEWRRQLAFDQQDDAIIELRRHKSHERITQAPAIIIPCLYMGEMDEYPDDDRNEAETIMAIQSLGCAVQNMLLMAYSLGLDGGWMCAPLFCPDIVVAALDLDPMLIPHALITLGYAAADPKRRERRSLDELIVRFD